MKARSPERLSAFGDMEDDVVSWKKAGSVYGSGGERKLERKRGVGSCRDFVVSGKEFEFILRTAKNYRKV